jgi:hypothetical protein
MQLNEFIHFNKKCPVCENDLTLYLQWTDSVCFRSKKIKNNIYHFEPFKCQNAGLSDQDYIDLFDYGTNFETKFSSSKVAAEAKRRQMYFFYLCKDVGFEDKHGDYEINIASGCYFRSTPYLEYQKEGKGKSWALKSVDSALTKIVNRDEALSFSKTVNNIEKVYMLQFDHANNKTVFMHYSANEDQRKSKDFEPNVFEKEMPMLTIRPNFSISNRERLLDRFDSWIVMS